MTSGQIRENEAFFKYKWYKGRISAVFSPGIESSIMDTVGGYMDSLFTDYQSADYLDKYVGTGTASEFNGVDLTSFESLGSPEQMALRRGFLELTPRRMKKARSVEINIPVSIGAPDYPTNRGEYSSILERAVNSFWCETLSNAFRTALYCLRYPMVKIRFDNSDLWNSRFYSILYVGIKAGRAPSMYPLIWARLPKIIEQGMFADIHDIITKWEGYENMPKIPLNATKVNGRHYSMPGNILIADCMMYRRDWCQEHYEWFENKGWIDSAGRAYIPNNWTWEEFREISGLFTDRSRNRIGFWYEMADMFRLGSRSLFYYGDFYVPDPTHKRTWVFFKDNPDLIPALEDVRNMYHRDRSIRTGVEVKWAMIHNNFYGGKAGIVPITSHNLAMSATRNKYSFFGDTVAFGDVVGMVAVPGSKDMPIQIIPSESSLWGFDPMLDQDQLRATFRWATSYLYEDLYVIGTRNNMLEHDLQGSESRVYRDMLLSPHPIKGFEHLKSEEKFPPDYVEYFRLLRDGVKYGAPPLPREFGLSEPLKLVLQQGVRAMFAEVIVDSTVDLKSLVKKWSRIIDEQAMSFKVENDIQLLKD
jgi:hypothetical protein